jgi:hypothetical protein
MVALGEGSFSYAVSVFKFGDESTSNTATQESGKGSIKNDKKQVPFFYHGYGQK